MALLRLSNIANYLTFERKIENAIQFVAMNVCPSGEVARIYLARLNSDSSLLHLGSFGFSEKFIASHKNINLSDFGYLLDSVSSREIVIKSEESEGPNDSVWKSSIYLPLLPNFAASITTQRFVSDIEESHDYFVALRSILNLYLQTWDALETSNGSPIKKPRAAITGDKLSERQELILEMMKSGMTNNAIADRLGYSESLIRQETMAIYLKLGINGRREINNPELN
ncbi:MAG: hypothetical protein RL733_8 [Actinomycetota bacterium]|jgi:DNA-binding CsgD family transcriptional regulator